MTCPACGEDAVQVSEWTQPKAGPIEIEGATIHEHDGDAYYHL